MIEVYSDDHFMRHALREAEAALAKDEVPVGAVIVANNRIIARAHNLTEALTDVTAHAEMQAFTSASENLGSKYLQDCTLYVTLEPCMMCSGAAYWTQIGRVVYGASDPRRGGLEKEGALHPKTTVTKGVLAFECAQILQEFFKQKRS